MGHRALNLVLLDLRRTIGGRKESKESITKGLDDLMHRKYMNTKKPFDKFSDDDDSPTNIEVNWENIVAATNLKNKIEKTVPSEHQIPPDSGDGSDVD